MKTFIFLSLLMVGNVQAYDLHCPDPYTPTVIDGYELGGLYCVNGSTMSAVKPVVIKPPQKKVEKPSKDEEFIGWKKDCSKFGCPWVLVGTTPEELSEYYKSVQSVKEKPTKKKPMKMKCVQIRENGYLINEWECEEVP